MQTFQVDAVSTRGGWELAIEGHGTTRVRSLEDAERQVRYFLTVLHERDFDAARIFVTPVIEP